MATNLERLFAYSVENKDIIAQKYRGSSSETALQSMPKVFLKMWDHINLAQRQYQDLKQTDEEFQQKFNQKMEPAKRKLEEQINGQLITLVGIFTALAFLVFGGITSLDNVFETEGVPVLKLIIIGAVWGLCILNTVFVFLYCVSRLIDRSIATHGTTVLQKYPIVIWSDFLLLSVMLICSWIYYLRNRDGLGWLDVFINRYPMLFSITGTIIIIAMITILFRFLIKGTNTKARQKNKRT